MREEKRKKAIKNHLIIVYIDAVLYCRWLIYYENQAPEKKANETTKTAFNEAVTKSSYHTAIFAFPMR